MKGINLLTVFLALFCSTASAQVFTGGTTTNGSTSTAIFTAVPFLTIVPDARSAGMGDAGVALSPSAFDNHWNASKLAFLDDENHISISYSPWLRRIAPDANLAYLNFASKIDDRNAIGFSLCYFNLGRVNAFDNNQNSLGTYQPSEYSFDASLARKFGENLSLGLAVRYIHSGIVNANSAFSATSGHAGNAFAADVSLYYKKDITQWGYESLLSFGLNVSNIGTKISYYDGGQKYFLPTNLKFGVADAVSFDQMNTLTFTFDVNKLMVPTPPLRDASGNITAGRDNDRSVVSGFFGSLSDAPGGFSEELKEISFSSGFEYMYNNQFALRAGYFYENPNKGDRRYLTLGTGFKYQDFGFDFSYLIANQNSSPLANTLRFTLGYNFGKSRGQ